MKTVLPAGARRALIIGINTYVRLPPRYQLDGCRNDALLMRSVLVEKFGFPESNVRMLLDGEATRDAILDAFDALVDETGEDDTVVVHYAGHGSQIRDREDDESDGRDETIVPCDAGRPPEPNRDITDDEIHLRLLRLGEKTRNITLIFDCCHSGTISRDLDAAKARQLEEDPRPPSELPPSPVSADDRARLAALSTRGPSGWFPIADRYVLISGCRDDEQSYEHTVESGDTPVKHGALTFFLTRALVSAVPGTTYRDVFDAVAAQVTAARAQQHPQIEGTLDREIFGVRDIEPMRYVRVTARTPGSPTVELGAGAAHGLTNGSIWTVHEAGAKQALDENRLGRLEIVDVQATRSEARVTEEHAPDAIMAGGRAVESAHQYGEMRMAVRMEGDRATDAAGWDGMHAAISAAGLLRLSTEPGPAVRAILVPARTTVLDTDAVAQLGPVAAPTWAVVSETGELMMPPRPSADYEPAVKNLEGWATFRLKLAIANASSTLAEDVSIEILRRTGGEWSPIEPDNAGGMRTVDVGDVIEIRVSNHGLEPLYVGLFDFRPTGEVKRLYPRGMTEALAAGQSIMLNRGRGFRSSYPSAFPFLPSPFADSPVQVVETLKAFITTEPTDYSSFEQETASRALDDRTSAHPLHRLMLASTWGTSRNLDAVAPDDWATVTVPFALRERRTLDLSNGEIAAGGVTLRATGLAGSVDVQGGERALRRDVAMHTTPLDHRLPANGIRTVQCLRIADMRASDPAGATPTHTRLQLSTREPPAGWGQMVIATDADGRMAWHFAEEVAADRAAARSMPSGLQTFSIVTGSAGAESGTARSLRVGQFPLVDPEYGAVGDDLATRWEASHRPHALRWLTAHSEGIVNARPFTDDDWRQLSAGRALLLVHGLFLRSADAFGGLTTGILEPLLDRYDGRIVAFDHPTISVDPRDNVRWLLGQVPAGTSLDIDIVAFGRGGLIGRVLAERAGELGGNGAAVRVGNIVLAGPAAEWTDPGEPHPGACIDRFASMLNDDRLPDGNALDGVIAVAKLTAIGATRGLDGIAAMRADSAFAAWLGPASPGRYTMAWSVPADASDTTARAGWLANTHVDIAILQRLAAGPA